MKTLTELEQNSVSKRNNLKNLNFYILNMELLLEDLTNFINFL